MLTLPLPFIIEREMRKETEAEPEPLYQYQWIEPMIPVKIIEDDEEETPHVIIIDL